MDKVKAVEIRKLFEEAMKGQEKKFEELGIVVKIGGGRYDHNSAYWKIEVAEKNEAGVVVSKEAEDFKLYAQLYGLEPDDLGRKFKDSGDDCEIIGLNTGAPKYPIQVLKNGRTFRYQRDHVKRLLGR